jgi:hypothetical protein
MCAFHWLRHLRHRPASAPADAHRRSNRCARRQAASRLHLEQLEPRLTPALNWHSTSLSLFGTDIGVNVTPNGQFFASDGFDILRSVDLGSTWQTVTPFASFAGNAIAYAPSDPATMIAGRGHGTLKSVDGGADWFSLPDLNAGDAARAIVFQQNNELSVYAGVGYGWGLYKSTNGGATWSNPLSSKDIFAVALDPTNAQIVYVGSHSYSGYTNGVLKSADGGTSWNSILPNTDVNSILVDPANPQRLYVGADDGSIYKSLDGGASWNAVTGSGIVAPVSALAFDPQNSAHLFAATSGQGVFYSPDSGTTWSADNQGLTDLNVVALAIQTASPYEVLAATYGGNGFWATVPQSATPPTVTAPTTAAVTSRSATLGGTVSSAGGATLLKRGVLYAPTATNSNVTLGGPGVIEVDDASATTGSFTENVTGLAPNTTYSFVAFASNSSGTSYTSPVSTFTTLIPTAGVSGPTDGVLYQSRIFTFTAGETAGMDAAGYTYTIHWGDGSPDLTVPASANNTTITEAHTYTTFGAYTVSVTATDQYGALSSPVSQAITIVSVAVENDPGAQGGVTGLAVGGTAGNDTFDFAPGSNAGDVVVTLNGTLLGTFHATGAVIADGGPGTDNVVVNGTAGNDRFVILAGGLMLNGVSYTGDGVEKWQANGQAGNDTFTVQAGGVAAIHGGTGTNTLIGPDQTNAWVLTGAGSGTLNGMSFQNLQNLTGGSGTDAFKIKPGGSVTGTLNGGTGTGNKLDFSLYNAAVTVNLQSKTATGMGHYANIQVLTGSPSSDTLQGANVATTWQITVINGGTVGSYSFTAFENLIGGSNNDIFKFSNGKNVSGTIDGGGGTNWLDYSAYTTAVSVNVSSAVYGSLPAGSATGVDGGAADGVANILNVRAGNGGSTLVGGGGNILVGGNGADTLVDTYAGASASGGSLLIGGKGADNLTGGTAGDILIGQGSSYATKNANLQDILAYWNTNSHSAAFTALQSSTGLPATHERLVWRTTVGEDGSADVLNGTSAVSAIDWFFAGTGDTINNGKHGTDYLNNGLY